MELNAGTLWFLPFLSVSSCEQKIVNSFPSSSLSSLSLNNLMCGLTMWSQVQIEQTRIIRLLSTAVNCSGNEKSKRTRWLVIWLWALWCLRRACQCPIFEPPEPCGKWIFKPQKVLKSNALRAAPLTEALQPEWKLKTSYVMAQRWEGQLSLQTSSEEITLHTLKSTLLKKSFGLY